jgi:hypothetical protein
MKIEKVCLVVWMAFLAAGCSLNRQPEKVARLRISDNKRYFVQGNKEPFFWLGDTGWLLPSKLNRQEAEKYLEDRRQKGFNVIQLSVLHSLGAKNVYGDSALVRRNPADPKVTPGQDPDDPEQYDYWDHVDYLVDLAAAKNLYMAVVLLWGNNVKSKQVTPQRAKQYAAFLANRYKDKPNIIWLNGGDIRGSDSSQVWQQMGRTLRQMDPNHLITFHPRGRTSSSAWFHEASWLDFNMFQSGHRRYDQDTSVTDLQFGEDNWRYVQVDYHKKPVKPTLDGEPSYEKIVQGLHDVSQPVWTDHDVRRYGYWSVFAGAAGYTYGHNAVMQMYQPGARSGAFGVKDFWYQGIDDPGAGQMQHLKKLMLARPYLERVPDQSLIAGANGQQYDFLVATRGRDYAFIYTCNGRSFAVNMDRIAGDQVKASWYNPRDGSFQLIGLVPNQGIKSFDPPGARQPGNDWVLVLDKK